MAQQVMDYRKRAIEEINHAPGEIIKETLDFIEFLKSRTGRKHIRNQGTREIQFGLYDLGAVKGNLSREEIYGEYLTDKTKSE
jgi:hypothetical protein